MLTDIFAHRYLDHPIWSAYTELEQRLLIQCFGIVKEALPYYLYDNKVNDNNREKWKLLHERIARELGVKELSPRYYSYSQKGPLGQDWHTDGLREWVSVCENFVTANFPAGHDADRFMKERISFVELALRLREDEIAQQNAVLPNKLKQALFRDQEPKHRLRVPGSAVDGEKALNAKINSNFNDQITELNERFRRAKAQLTYHNGYIQVSMDGRIEQQIARPFWELVAAPMWANVDIDMKEALDRRDSNDKDPALFAAKALESAIKIVSDTKKWTRGTEKGAANYVDNLMSKANGGFLTVWEGEMLKQYFSKVRNSLGHGPGSEPMPSLDLPQTDWAIETAMSWVRTLVRRM